MKLFKVGIHPHNSEWLNIKIELSNRLAFYMFLFSAINALNFLFTAPPASIFPFCSAAGVLVGIGLNGLRMYEASRFLLSVVCLTSVFLFHSFTHPAGSIPSDGAILLAFAFSLFPFVLFGEKERLLMGVSFLINILLLYFFKDSPALFGETMDVPLEAVDSLQNQNVMKLSSFVLVALIFIYFIRNNQRALDSNNELREAIEKQNQELLASKNEMEDKLHELDRSKKQDDIRNQISRNLSDFGKLLRDTSDLAEVYDQAVSFLVRSVKANQAGLYVVEMEEETKPFLQLKACYAYERKKFIDRSFEVGEGLLGQAYLEKEKVLLTEIPQKYIRITSGLGDAPPTCLLIIPMIHQEKVEGVLEIASFHCFEKYQIELLEQACLALASEISAYRVQMQTRSLLREAQMQAEQLQSQEEEMRQSMEELHATQETMVRKEKESAELMKRIQEKEAYTRAIFDNARDGIILIDEKGSIEMFNPAAEKMFLYSANEVKGKNIKILMSSQYSEKHDGYLLHHQKTGERRVLGRTRAVEGLRKTGEIFPLEIKIEKGRVNDKVIFIGMLTELNGRLSQKEASCEESREA